MFKLGKTDWVYFWVVCGMAIEIKGVEVAGFGVSELFLAGAVCGA